METNSENIFDPELFRSDLQAKTEEYAKNRYITFGTSDTAEKNERKKARYQELYSELLDDCAEALLATNNQEATMEIIRTTLVRYRYGGGQSLFAVSSEASFYHDLSLRLAKQASEK